jgi:hypothetical protein
MPERNCAELEQEGSYEFGSCSSWCSVQFLGETTAHGKPNSCRLSAHIQTQLPRPVSESKEPNFVKPWQRNLLGLLIFLLLWDRVTCSRLIFLQHGNPTTGATVQKV